MSKNNGDDIMKLLVAHLDRIENKVDKLDERLDSSEKVAIKQESNLEIHMKRSDLLEKSQEDLRTSVKPILKAYLIAWGLIKIIGALGVLLGIIGGILKLMGLV
jgi:hypothetical protein